MALLSQAWDSNIDIFEDTWKLFLIILDHLWIKTKINLGLGCYFTPWGWPRPQNWIFFGQNYLYMDPIWNYLLIFKGIRIIISDDLPLIGRLFKPWMRGMGGGGIPSWKSACIPSSFISNLPNQSRVKFWLNRPFTARRKFRKCFSGIYIYYW